MSKSEARQKIIRKQERRIFNWSEFNYLDYLDY